MSAEVRGESEQINVARDQSEQIVMRLAQCDAKGLGIAGWSVYRDAVRWCIDNGRLRVEELDDPDEWYAREVVRMAERAPA